MGFHLFGTFIPYYGLCIVLGIACASLLAAVLCKKGGIDFNDCIVISAYFVAFGFLGAKILFLITSAKSIEWKRVFCDFGYFNSIMNSGFVFYGGFLGGLCALPVLRKAHKIRLRPYLQVLAPCVALAHGFGRIGCSLAGCCYGKPVSGSFAFVYTQSVAAPNGTRLFPVQGVEAAALFVLALALAILVLRKSRIPIPEFYIASYSVLRFALEFFRGDSERGFVGILSTSQFVSILLMAFLAVKFCFGKSFKFRAYGFLW